MARLKTLGARIATLDTQVVKVAQPREVRRAYNGKAYDRRSWRDGIRPAKLRQDPLCVDCSKQGRAVAATEVDHVDGDPENNSPENLASMCKPCHSRKTARHDGSFGNTVNRSK